MSKNKFAPLFWVQCFGAFNDNIFKNALLIFFSIKITSISELTWQSNLSTGLFILPVVLFSAIAGQISDKYNKAKLVRKIKLLEISKVYRRNQTYRTDIERIYTLPKVYN